MEKWVLDHPVMGRFEAWVGTRDEVRALDPGFPARSDSADHEHTDGAGAGDERTEGADATALPERVTHLQRWLHLDDHGERPRLVLWRDGKVVVRLNGLQDGRFALRRDELADQDTSTPQPSMDGDRLEFDIASLGRFVVMIRLRHGDEVVNFEPPAGSPAARRQRAIDESPVKALWYSLLAGMGKSGWAITVLVLGPLIGRLVRWLESLLPDVDIPWPDIPWPHVNWPRIPWPHINWPDIPWPNINWPHIPWPEWTPPGWVIWMAEHPKVWIPLLVGLVAGISATRKNQTSSRTKKQCNQQRRDQELTRLATALSARKQQLGDGGGPPPQHGDHDHSTR